MTVNDKILQDFFNKQKKPRIDALVFSKVNKHIKKNKKININNNQKLVSKWYQSSIKVVSKRNQNYHFYLTGLQRKITDIIYNICELSCSNKTYPISILQLSNQCNHNVNTVKIAIHRLIKKGILIRENFKNGRGGWTMYSIPDNIYKDFI